MTTLLQDIIRAISNAASDSLLDQEEKMMVFTISPIEKNIFSYILGAHQLGTPLKEIANVVAEMGKDDNPTDPESSTLCRAYLRRSSLTKHEIRFLKSMKGNFCEISHKYIDTPDWNIKYRQIFSALDPDFELLLQNN